MFSVSDMVRQTVVAVLPTLTSSDLDAITSKLVQNVGVTCAEDLCHVVEQDLVPLLKPIQCRKLLASLARTSTYNLI